MQNVNVNVAGIAFSIRSDGDPSYIESLAAELSTRYLALRKGKPRVEQDLKLMTMIALSLLDDLRSAQAKAQAQKAEAQQFAADLLQRIDDLLESPSAAPETTQGRE